MAKERSKLQRKIDSFSRALFLDENGKPKSATFLYSFLLALLYAAIDAAAYLLLLDPLEHAFSGASVTVRNAAEYLVPAIAAAIPCVALFFAFRKKRQLVPCAYLWMTAMLLAMMLFMLLLVDWSDGWTDYRLFLRLLALPAALSILSGGVPAFLLYRRELKKQKAAEQAAPKRPSYYNT